MSQIPPRLTAEQEAPKSVRNTSVALAAGAGCGKTTVLTDRFLAYLEDGLPLEQIVALTFTEKAARQLVEKIREACLLRASAADDSEFWKAIVRRLESAKIGTFHSFCGEILRQFPVEAGVEPGSRVVEETIGPTLRDEAMANAIRRWLANGNPDFLALAIDRGVPKVREALAELLNKRAGRDLTPWLQKTPTEIVERWEAFRDGEALQPMLRTLENEAIPLLRLLEENVPSHPVMKARRAILLSGIPGLTKATDARKALATIRDSAIVQGGGTKKDWPSAEGYEAIQKALTKFRKLIDRVLDILEPDNGRSLKAGADGLRFARLANEVVNAYTSAKRTDGLIDYDDQLLLVRDLLRDGPKRVRDSISQSIGVLLVDEFQDTDAIQAEILEQLAGDDLLAGRLFLVGDSKQSIYRFRGAQPAIFETYRKRFPESGRLNLTANFRSVPSIIAFVNALFADAFPGNEHLLRPGPNSREISETAVEFLWADAKSNSNKPNADERRTAEARAIASTLKTRLEAGWPIRDGIGTRLATQADVAILFRSLNDAPAYEQALAAEGLDYHVVKGSAYFAQQEVIDLINVLSTIEDPHDTLALAGTLRGPFFGISDDGLYWVGTAFGRDLRVGFDRWNEIVELSDVDRKVLAEAHRCLNTWRDHKDRESIAALLNRILDESGFEPALLGEFLGARKRANVRKLVKMAHAFDLHGGFTLADFVARLRADLNNPPKEEQASTTDEYGQAIRLMTIHQAKGLEFPIVVVPDLDRSHSVARPTVTIHPVLGPVARPCEGDPDLENEAKYSLGWELLDKEEDRAEAEEATRVFYVAVTRAMDALILSSGSDPAADGASTSMKLLDTRFNRINGECKIELPENWPKPIVRVISPPSSSNRKRRNSFLPKPVATAKRIERGLARSPAASLPQEFRRPQFLDLVAARGLNARASRMDELLRHALVDPNYLDQVPDRRAANKLRRRLSATVVDRLAKRIEAAANVRQGIPWLLAWPFDDPSATVLRGRIDFAFQESETSWSLANFCLEEASVAVERLNMMLSAYAASGLGLGAVKAAWLIRLGETEHVSQIKNFAVENIDSAIAEVLAAAH